MFPFSNQRMFRYQTSLTCCSIKITYVLVYVRWEIFRAPSFYFHELDANYMCESDSNLSFYFHRMIYQSQSHWWRVENKHIVNISYLWYAWIPTRGIDNDVDHFQTIILYFSTATNWEMFRSGGFDWSFLLEQFLRRKYTAMWLVWLDC